VHTQLRLVDAPKTSSTEQGPAARRRPSARRVKGRAARRVTWGADWHLDTKVRRVGREGVAAARQALAEATPPDGRLRKAS